MGDMFDLSCTQPCNMQKITKNIFYLATQKFLLKVQSNLNQFTDTSTTTHWGFSGSLCNDQRDNPERKKLQLPNALAFLLLLVL